MVDKTIAIPETEYRQFMDYIAANILDIRLQYNSLRATKEDRLNPANKTGSLSLKEIKNLQQDLITRQHRLFRQWYKMNQRLHDEGCSYYTAKMIQEVGGHVLRVTRYMDVIKREVALEAIVELPDDPLAGQGG